MQMMVTPKCLRVYEILLFVDALQQGASQFEQQAKSLKNKFWLQNLKVTAIILFFQ